MVPTPEQMALSLASSQDQVDPTKSLDTQHSKHAENALAKLYPDAVDFPGTAAFALSSKQNWYVFEAFPLH